MTVIDAERLDQRLDQLRRDAPHCLGLAWLAGAPLAVIAASGEPGASAREGASWADIASAAPVLLHDGPVISSEVLVRSPAGLLLLSERETGVVAVAIAVHGAGSGMALVQARMMAAQVGG